MNNSDIEVLEEVEVLDDGNKRKPVLKRILFIVLLMFVCGGGFILLTAFPNNKKDTSTSFFVKNNDNLFAIFNGDGNKISDFIYKEVSYFIHNSSFVYDKNGTYSIVSDDGKTLVESGKYALIERRHNIYIARDYNELYILDSLGKEVYKIKETDVSFTSIDDVAILKKKDSYLIINYDGDVLVEFKIDKNSKQKPVLNGKDNYISAYYNGINHIIDLNKKKIVQTINEKQRYCISDVNTYNPKELIIYSCIINPTDEIKYNYRVISSGKISIKKDSNDLSNLKFSNNNILYSIKSDSYLLDDDGKEKLKLESMQYIDKNHYASITEDAINIYVKDKVKTETNCRFLNNGYANKEIYLLENCNSATVPGYYAYYDKDGKKIGKVNFSQATTFDENSRAVVSEDGYNYYLIDEKANIIGNRYNRIEKFDDCYVGVDGSTSKLFDKDGKTLIKGDSIIKKEFTNYTVLLIRKNKKYIIYDLKRKTKVITLKQVPVLEDNYFIIKDKKGVNYYSYSNGKMFYSTV